MSMDYERVLLLLEVIERTNQHGPAFNELRGEAAKELSKIMEDFKKNAGKVVTPPDGPANSAIANEDGTYTRIPPAPIRMANESDEAWEKRQAEHAENLPELANPQTRPVTNPRANERVEGETDAQFKARTEPKPKDEPVKHNPSPKPKEETENAQKFKDEIKPDPNANLRRV